MYKMIAKCIIKNFKFVYMTWKWFFAILGLDLHATTTSQYINIKYLVIKFDVLRGARAIHIFYTFYSRIFLNIICNYSKSTIVILNFSIILIVCSTLNFKYSKQSKLYSANYKC